MFWIVVSTRHPTFLQIMVELVWLDLSSCSLGGQFSSWVSSLSSLTWIYFLWTNQSERVIPSSLSNLPENLFSWPHWLGGNIHPNYPKLEQLRVFQTGEDLISGPLPNELKNCTSMMPFDMGFHNFTGEKSKGTWNIWKTRSSWIWVVTDIEIVPLWFSPHITIHQDPQTQPNSNLRPHSRRCIHGRTPCKISRLYELFWGSSTMMENRKGV